MAWRERVPVCVILVVEYYQEAFPHTDMECKATHLTGSGALAQSQPSRHEHPFLAGTSASGVGYSLRSTAL